MSTATNNEFYERQSIEEFLGEHEVVRELYGTFAWKINRVFGEDYELFSEREILQMFNYAYYICMRLTDGSGCSLNEAWFEKQNQWFSNIMKTKDYVFVLVRSILLVHRGLLHFDEAIIHDIRVRVSKPFSWTRFDKVTNLYAYTLKAPLNFCGLPRKAPAVQRDEQTDPMPLLERAASDIAKAGERMKEQLAAKDKRIEELENALRLEQEKENAKDRAIKELENQVKLEQTRRKTMLATRDKRIGELEDRLKLELSTGKAELALKDIRIKELEGRNASLSQNPFCLDKLKDYAKGLDKEEAKVITHMLLTIALDEQLPMEKLAEVRKAVKEVDVAHRKQAPAYVHIERQEIHNENKDSQVFNGPIDHSNFGK